MRFSIGGIGALREATLDLSKDLILFTGRNNTSKTYAAHAVYGFCSRTHVRTRDALSQLLADAPKINGSLDLAPFASGYALEKLVSTIEQNYLHELSDVFAAEEGFAQGASVHVTPAPGIEEELLSIHLPSARSGDTVASKVKGETHVNVLRIPQPGTTFTEDTGEIATTVGGWVLSRALFRQCADATIFTAERSAIQLFSRELSLRRAAMVEDMLKQRPPGIGPAQDAQAYLRSRARQYPLAIRDGLRFADSLAYYHRRPEITDTENSRLDIELLGGRVSVGEDGDMAFTPRDAPQSLALHLASSSVKSLATLAFYVGHVPSDEFILIDEPELNLHPHNQRLMARFLCRLARNGAKVLISTHSDYIIREINTLVMLNNDNADELRRKFSYDERETISNGRVGAYMFTGSEARQLEVSETGVEVPEIDEEIEQQQRVAQAIYFRLFNRK